MNEDDPSADAIVVADAIRVAGDAKHGEWDLVAKYHAEEISSGLREAAGTLSEEIGKGFSDAFVSAVQVDEDGQGRANIVDGLFAVARVLARIASVLEVLAEK